MSWLNGEQLPDSVDRVRAVLDIVGAGQGQGELLLRLYGDAQKHRPPTLLDLALQAWSSALRRRGRLVETSQLKVMLALLVCCLLGAGFALGRLL